MVGIYCRISGNKEEDKDTSIDIQEERGIAFAKSEGLSYKLYYDIGKSGTSEKERDDFNAFIKDIKKKVITHIYAINQSRIERNLDTWRMFVATVINAGAQWFPDGKHYDLESTTNKMLASMLSLVNEFHAENTSDLVKLSHMKRAKQGKGHGIRSFGIRYDDEGFMQHHEDEIKVVKKIFDWSLDGIGAYSIARKLNEAGEATRYAKLGKSTKTKDKYTGKLTEHKNRKWWGSTVHGILTNKIYMGIYEFGTKPKGNRPKVVEEIPLPHLAILTPEEFQLVQDNLKKNKKEKVGQPAKHKYLLNGLLFCSECGNKYFGKRRKASRENTYKCSGKQAPLYACNNSRGFNIARFETFILKHLFMTKDLQELLNSIEVDDDTLELMMVKKKQLKNKIVTSQKMISSGINLMYEFPDDDAVKEKYISEKNKKERFAKELDELNTKIALYENNNRLGIVNSTIEGFDINSGFEGIKQSIHKLIEQIEVDYIPLKKNGRFIFKIKYKGFLDEYVSFAATQQLDRFACIEYYSKADPAKYGQRHYELGGVIHQKDKTVLLPHANFNYAFDRFSSKNKLSITISKDELIEFD